MKEIRYSLISLFLMALLAGCSQSASQLVQNQVTASVNPVFVQSTQISGPITMEILKNAEYQAQNGMTLVKMVDGKYETGSGTDYLSVSMLDQAAFGDLNSDGIQDAAIILMENYGGTGQFGYLVPVFNNGGSASPSSGFFLGDRVVINSMSIVDERIKLGILVHAPNDALCCPSQPMTQSYKFFWGPGLVLVNATFESDTGGMREIIIDAPEKGSMVSKQIQITGSVSISPFENTLVVRIMDANNSQIYQGPITVSAPDMGAPGTFDAQVELSDPLVSMGLIRIEIIDMSMADGSTLAMDSVEVTLK